MPRCKWSWRRMRCVRPPPPPPPPPPGVEPFVLFGALLAVLLLLCLLLFRRPPGILRTVLQLVFCRGTRRRGRLTGLRFPIHAGELTPVKLTQMLRHGGHIGEQTWVATVHDRLAVIRDGVKGDKAIIDVSYKGVEPGAAVPTTFFVKFAIRKLSAMRLLCAASEVHECEALFYHHLASDCPLLVPRAFFVDFHETSNEFCLVSELLPFGSANCAPLKHRVRDAPTIAEQRLLAVCGAELHTACWGDAALRRGCRRKDATFRRAWPLMQALSLMGLRHTTRRTVGGRPRAAPFITWDPPAELVGLERALIGDMPAILASLCDEVALTAFGHNDIVMDNVWLSASARRGTAWLLGVDTLLPSDAATPGFFDWQQSCVNSVGQEWAWNWHFLPPDFLTAHESELVDLVLATYASRGQQVARADFLRHYVLGCVQMYCFSGGGLQALMKRLDARGLLAALEPDDARCRDGSLAHDAPLLEMVVGAEMSRRAFTNACNIMRRHGFAGQWRAWRAARGKAALPTPSKSDALAPSE